LASRHSPLPIGTNRISTALSSVSWNMAITRSEWARRHRIGAGLVFHPICPRDRL
jgi:hypothetical protein